MSLPAIYPIILPPDPKSMLIEHLRNNADMTSVVAAERITGRVPDVSGSVPTHNWLALVSIGGRDPFGSVPHMFPHLQAHCMGTSAYESVRIWRYLKAVLEHPSYRQQGFISQGYVVYDVRVGLPAEQPDLGVRTWDKRVAPIYMTISEVPLP